jgi:hypothetical protein
MRAGNGTRIAVVVAAVGIAAVALLGCAASEPREHAKALPAPPAPQRTEARATLEVLVAIERRSWDAWKGHDGAFFGATLADDHLDVGFGGPVDKASVVAGVNSPACTVRSFAVDRFRLLDIDADTALLVYRAEQDTTCGNFRVPSPAWVSSLYVRRGGRWQNVLFQQTATPL